VNTPGALGGWQYEFQGSEPLDKVLAGFYFNDHVNRLADIQLARWNGVDPLADYDVQMSPYLYLGADPINTRDPDGRARQEGQTGRLYYDWDLGHYMYDGEEMSDGGAAGMISGMGLAFLSFQGAQAQAIFASLRFSDLSWFAVGSAIEFGARFSPGDELSFRTYTSANSGSYRANSAAYLIAHTDAKGKYIDKVTAVFRNSGGGGCGGPGQPPCGQDPYQKSQGEVIYTWCEFREANQGLTAEEIMNQRPGQLPLLGIIPRPGGPKMRYVIEPITQKVMDMRHVIGVGYMYGELAGAIFELLDPSPSRMDLQDFWSNRLGDDFGYHYGIDLISDPRSFVIFFDAFLQSNRQRRDLSK